MIRLRFYSFVILVLLIQITLLNRLKIFDSKPDIVFILVIFSGLFFGARLGLESGIVAGILTDVFSAGHFGLSAIVLGAAGFLAAKIGPKIYRESKPAQFAVVFLFYIVAASIYYGLEFVPTATSSFLRDCAPTYGEFLARSVLPADVYTSLTSPGIFVILMKHFDFKEV